MNPYAKAHSGGHRDEHYDKDENADGNGYGDGGRHAGFAENGRRYDVVPTEEQDQHKETDGCGCQVIFNSSPTNRNLTPNPTPHCSSSSPGAEPTSSPKANPNTERSCMNALCETETKTAECKSNPDPKCSRL